jgi:hypothetical protein
MLINRQFRFGTLAVILGSLLATSAFALTDDSEQLLTANGKGTIKVGRESFALSSVIIKLAPDGQADITLVSEITFFLKGKWSKDNTAPNIINLEITGSMTAGGAQGTGKLTIRADKSLDRFTAQGGTKTSARKVSIDFVAN